MAKEEQSVSLDELDLGDEAMLATSPKLKAWAAVRSGDAKALALALEQGADPHMWAVSEWGDEKRTLLMLAAQKGHDECVRVLIPVSDMDAQHDQMTALMLAAQGEHDLCVELLLPRSDPDATNGYGRNALMLAAMGGGTGIGCIRMLADASDLLAQDREGQTALMIAANNGNEAAVRILMWKMDPNFQDMDGRTALMWAALGGCVRCVEALLPVSDPLVRDRDAGWTALMWAIMGGYANSAQKIVEACPEAACGRLESGESCLDMAAKNGELACVQLLLGCLEAGSLVDAISSACTQARSKGYMDIVDELVEAMARAECSDISSEVGSPTAKDECEGSLLGRPRL